MKKIKFYPIFKKIAIKYNKFLNHNTYICPINHLNVNYYLQYLFSENLILIYLNNRKKTFILNNIKKLKNFQL